MRRLFAAALAALLLLCGGCTHILAPTSTPPPTLAIPDDPTVKTDWSRLTPYAPEAPIYIRRYADFTDTLIPASDYGPLVPFLGDRLGGYPDGNRYGLMTLQGELVTDPVFADVWNGGGYGPRSLPPLPYLMLEKQTLSTTPDDWDGTSLWAMAAPDGSWCTEFRYQMDSELTIWGRSINGNADERGLFVLDGAALVYLDGATGRELLRVTDIPRTYLYDTLFRAHWRDGAAILQPDGWGGPIVAIDAATGARAELTEAEAARAELAYRDGKALDYQEGEWAVVDAAGAVLLQAPQIFRATWEGGDQFIACDTRYGDNDAILYRATAVYDAATLARTESPLVGKDIQDMPGGGWCWYAEGENVCLTRGDQVYALPAALGQPDGPWGRVVFFHSEAEDSVVTLDGQVLYRGPWDNFGMSWPGCDLVTGRTYLRLPAEGGYHFYTDEGAPLGAAAAPRGEAVTLANGLQLVTGEGYSGLRDLDGNWIFYYPLPAGEWD